MDRKQFFYYHDLFSFPLFLILYMYVLLLLLLFKIEQQVKLQLNIGLNKNKRKQKLQEKDQKLLKLTTQMEKIKKQKINIIRHLQYSLIFHILASIHLKIQLKRIIPAMNLYRQKLLKKISMTKNIKMKSNMKNKIIMNVYQMKKKNMECCKIIIDLKDH